MKRVIACALLSCGASLLHAKPLHPFYGSLSGGSLTSFDNESQEPSGPLFALNRTFGGKSGVTLGDSMSIGANIGYFVTDNVAFEAGFNGSNPFKVYGTVYDGLQKNREALSRKISLGKAQQLEAELSVKYFFRIGPTKIRPFIGLGVACDHIVIKNRSNTLLPNSNTQLLNMETESLGVSPFLTSGITYDINKRWFAGMSVDLSRAIKQVRVTHLHPVPYHEAYEGTSSVEAHFAQVRARINLGYRF